MICTLFRIILFHSRYETRSLLLHHKPAMLHGMAILV